MIDPQVLTILTEHLSILQGQIPIEPEMCHNKCKCKMLVYVHMQLTTFDV